MAKAGMRLVPFLLIALALLFVCRPLFAEGIPPAPTLIEAVGADEKEPLVTYRIETHGHANEIREQLLPHFANLPDHQVIAKDDQLILLTTPSQWRTLRPLIRSINRAEKQFMVHIREQPQTKAAFRAGRELATTVYKTQQPDPVQTIRVNAGQLATLSEEKETTGLVLFPFTYPHIGASPSQTRQTKAIDLTVWSAGESIRVKLNYRITQPNGEQRNTATTLTIPPNEWVTVFDSQQAQGQAHSELNSTKSNATKLTTNLTTISTSSPRHESPPAIQIKVTAIH